MKYFVVSDVHGFYKELRKALKERGYDPNNEEHVFVSCGDLFDRGPDAQKCLDFVMSLPKDRRIFIRGNHEDLLEKAIEHHHISITDVYNKTADTICQLGGTDRTESSKALDACKRKRKLKAYFNECRNFYETKDYIFCHGFIPLNYEGTPESKTFYREAPDEEWQWARWDNGFDCWWNNKDFDNYLPDKTIVIGHWHTSYAHHGAHHFKKEWPSSKDKLDECCFEPFIDNGIIGLDACTALTGKVNCVVLDN